jgi:hypothetical protein
MNAARDNIGPTVQELIAPLMSAPTELIGTGEVAFTDLPAIERR